MKAQHHYSLSRRILAFVLLAALQLTLLPAALATDVTSAEETSATEEALVETFDTASEGSQEDMPDLTQTEESVSALLSGGALYDDRYLVSETSWPLAAGITEYETITNNSDGTRQNIDYFCEIDPDNVTTSIIVGYPGMSSALENQELQWRMQGVSGQVADLQRYFDSSTAYEDYTIVAALNGDYYNMSTGQPSGVLIIDGTVYNPTSGGYYFAITKDGEPIISNNTDLSNLDYAVGGGSLLLKDGAVQVSAGGRNVTYTAIGIKADGTVVSMVCYGQNYPISCGYTPDQVAKMMQARGCVTALMLDGSGSSTWVSRHEGEDGVTVRNHPSDGEERMTSSCIMLISTAHSDGVFDHASLSPNNLLYTPESTIAFSATGSDKSGAPAPLPEEGLSWALADDRYGSIDADGVFISSGVCGEVEVQLLYQNEVVGTTTITIAEPDQLIFSAEKVSVGFGGTSTLGFSPRYQGRELIYKDGDFLWTLSDEGMGSFTGNVFTAHLSNSITGTATVTSRWNETVTATVTVEVGKEPIVAMDFEGGDYKVLHGTTQDGLGDVIGVFDENGTYTTDADAIESAKNGAEMYCVSYTDRNAGGQPQVGKVETVSRADGYPVRSGSYALKLDYNFSQNNNATDGACFGYAEDIVLEGDPTSLGIWVYVPEGTPNLWLRLRYIDGTGNSSQVNFAETTYDSENSLSYNADGAWHYFEADISHLKAPVTIPAGMALRVMVLTYAGSGTGWTLADGTKIDKSECVGTLYFDNLTYVFGGSNEDVTPPVVSSFTVNGEEISDDLVVEDSTLAVKAYFEDSTETNAFNTGIDTDNVFLYVDGQLIEDAFIDPSEGSIRHDNLTLSDGPHQIRLLVTDVYGNETVRTYTVHVNAGGDAAPVTMAIRETSAILGETVTVDFTPRDDLVTAMDVQLSMNKAYREKIDLTAGDGWQVVSGPEYDEVRNRLSFSVKRTSGGSATGTAATLTFQVPVTIVPGTTFTLQVTGGLATITNSGDTLPYFSSDLLSLPVVAPYTVSSGVLVKGLSETLYFTVTNTESGEPVAGIPVYWDNGTSLGTSGEDGRVAIPADTEVGQVTVYAQDNDGRVSGRYSTLLCTPNGNEDGTPRQVLQNACKDDSTSANFSWISHPLYSGDAAVLRLADSQEGLSTGTTYNGTSELLAFTGDIVAVRLNQIVLTDLTPGTTYYYQVGDGQEGHWSEPASFTTAWSGGDLDVLLFADLQETNNENLTGILNNLDLSDYALTIQTGDLVDKGNFYSLWNSALDMLSSITTDRLLNLGNHEMEGGLNPALTLYNQEGDCYSVTYGGLFIAVLASAGGSEGYAQSLQKLAQDAAASTAPWKILITHQPPYYTNTAGGSEGAHDLIPAMVEQAGFDAVFSGHDHSYARTESLLNGQVSEDGQGVTYFICGSLGEKSYAITDNPDFHFAKLSDDYNAVYLTLSIRDNTMTVTAYNYLADGSTEVLDTWTKTKNTEHVHDYTWDGAGRLTCSCGYSRDVADYTGIVKYQDGQVSFYLGTLRTDWFTLGEQIYHAGEDGILHDVITYSTATCSENGYLKGYCNDCDETFTGNLKRSTGHSWDENYVCTNYVFNEETMSLEPCGYHGRSIENLPITLGYRYGFYDGEPRRPSVTITDTLDDGTVYKLVCQSTYGDCMYYIRNNVEVGVATIELEGYGNYYGTRTIYFEVRPRNIETISVSGVTNGCALLTWEESLGAEAYAIYRSSNGGTSWSKLDTTTECSYELTGLEPGDTYTYMVRPYAIVEDTQQRLDGSYDTTFYSTRYSPEVTLTVEEGDAATVSSAVLSTEYTISTNEQEDASVASALTSVATALENGGLSCGTVLEDASNALTAQIESTLGGKAYMELNKAGIEGDAITLAITPRLQATLQNATLDSNGKILTLTLDLAAQYDVRATTADLAAGEAMVEEGDQKNTVLLSENQTLTLTEPVTLKLTLADTLGANPEEPFYIIHTPEYGSRLTYQGQLTTEDDIRLLTFTTAKGLGSFLLTQEITASITGEDGTSTYYASLQEAVNAVPDGGQIALMCNCDESITVTRAVSFTLITGDFTFNGTIAPGRGYSMSQAENGLYVFVRDTSELPFTDVNTDQWYYDDVLYVKELGLMNGTSSDNFSPLDTTDRAMAAMLLYRLADCPALSEDLLPVFTDVEEGLWYYDPVRWAASVELVNGTSPDKFSPLNNVTREQLAVMLYRYANFANLSTSAKGDLTAFTDASSVSSWAKDAMSWAVGVGLINGRGTVLAPQSSATRAEVAAILARFCKDVLR